MRTSFWILAALSIVCAAQSNVADARLQIVSGVQSNGRATLQWQAMLAKRLAPDKSERFASLAKPYSPAELEWEKLVRSRQPRWETEISKLAAPFDAIGSPQAIIVLGNRGGEDAFTHDPHTIGFDLEKLNELYGDATSAENVDRIDRLFRHEYTHLLQKAWLSKRPLPVATPLQFAVAEMWTEGMGNYYSLSANWRSKDGKPAARATDALRTLEPKLVSRLTALSCATPEQAHELTSDLSSGPFDKKWGALPVALWLEQESSNPEFLREFVMGGDESVWSLAEKHIARELKPQLLQIRRLEGTCGISAHPGPQ